MSKLQIRNPLLITALALAPSVAFAAGDSNPSKTTTSTSNTTPAPSNGMAPASPSGTTSGSGSLDNPTGSAVLSPTTPPDMTAGDEARLNRSGNPDQTSIDPAQVQKVFGRDVALIDLKGLNKDQIKQLQQRLQERGLYHGKIDGAMGPQTRNALSGLMAQQYSLNQRLMNQGQITEQFASSVGVDTHGRAPVTGVDLNAPGTLPSTTTTPATRPATPPPANQ